MKKIVCILIFIIYSVNSFSQNHQNVLLISGFDKYEYSIALKLVSEKWNIKIKRAAGSTVGARKLDSINKENGKLWNKLNQTIPDAKEKFYNEVNKQLIPILNSLTIIDSNKEIQKKLQEYKTDTNYITQEFKKISKNGNVIWEIVLINKSNDSSNCKLFNIEVDWKEKNFKIVN